MKTRHLLPAAALISILCAVSCKKGETVISTYENQVDQKLEQTDSAGVTITQSIEYLESIEGGKALCSKVNNLIVKFCFGDSYDGYELRPASEDYAASLVDDYRKDAGETNFRRSRTTPRSWPISAPWMRRSNLSWQGRPV